ncbi:hypothetical protein MKW98_026286, partial [Papaver atlanticum]
RNHSIEFFNETLSPVLAPSSSNEELQQDRPSTKVHAAPGGGSSLGYLFGGGGGSN